MTREEAINVVRNIYQTDAEKEALETLIPELKESEDERIAEELIKALRGISTGLQYAIFLTEEKKQRWLSWLEKQKEQRPVWSEEDEQNVSALLSMLDIMRDLNIKGALSGVYSKRDREEKFNAIEKWLKFLHERFGPQPKQERNEEDEREKFLVRCKSRDMFFKVGDIRLAYKADEPSTGYFVYLDESKGNDVMPYDERKFNKHFEIIEKP